MEDHRVEEKEDKKVPVVEAYSGVLRSMNQDYCNKNRLN